MTPASTRLRPSPSRIRNLPVAPAARARLAPTTSPLLPSHAPAAIAAPGLPGRAPGFCGRLIIPAGSPEHAYIKKREQRDVMPNTTITTIMAHHGCACRPVAWAWGPHASRRPPRVPHQPQDSVPQALARGIMVGARTPPTDRRRPSAGRSAAGRRRPCRSPPGPGADEQGRVRFVFWACRGPAQTTLGRRPVAVPGGWCPPRSTSSRRLGRLPTAAHGSPRAGCCTRRRAAQRSAFQRACVPRVHVEFSRPAAAGVQTSTRNTATPPR